MFEQEEERRMFAFLVGFRSKALSTADLPQPLRSRAGDGCG